MRSSDDRIHAIDGLRGFALWGIVVVHMIEQFLGGYPPPGMADYAVHIPLDEQIKALNRAFFLSKFFTIFSLLFGLSFFIQMDRAGRRGHPFAGRFAWRLILLFAIGMAHNLFFRGDILTVYALLGLLLIPFYRLPSWSLLLAALGIISGLPRYVLLWAKLKWTDSMSAWERAAFQEENTQYFLTIKYGSLWEVFSLNAWEGWLDKMSFQFDIFGRGYLTFAMFLIGLWLGRIRFFEHFMQKKRLLLALFFGGLLLAFALQPLQDSLLEKFNSRSWRTIYGLTVQDLRNLALSVSIVCGFLGLYLLPAARKLLDGFVAYGRMALSNYFGQTLIGTFIFFGWGLGLIADIGAATAFLLAQGITVVQILFSRFWLRYFHYGPLEWLWRSGTYMKWQNIQKKGLPQ